MRVGNCYHDTVRFQHELDSISSDPNLGFIQRTYLIAKKVFESPCRTWSTTTAHWVKICQDTKEKIIELAEFPPVEEPEEGYPKILPARPPAELSEEIS